MRDFMNLPLIKKIWKKKIWDYTFKKTLQTQSLSQQDKDLYLDIDPNLKNIIYELLGNLNNDLDTLVILKELLLGLSLCICWGKGK